MIPLLFFFGLCWSSSPKRPYIPPLPLDKIHQDGTKKETDKDIVKAVKALLPKINPKAQPKPKPKWNNSTKK